MSTDPASPGLRPADFLEPLSPGAPCGPDLEYDQAFVMLQASVAPKAENQYGDFVDTPQPVNWPETENACRALLMRTRDIRLVVVLVRCRVRLAGARGLRDGLAFVLAMLERYGEHLHPVPFADGERDPAMYANAIAMLADPTGLLADIRDIALPRMGGPQLQVRDIERSFCTPRPPEALAPELSIRLLQGAWNGREEPVVALAQAQRTLARIVVWLDDTLGEHAPDLRGLATLLQPFSEANLTGAGAFSSVAVPALSNPVSQAASPDISLTNQPADATPPHAPLVTSPQPSAGPLADRWNALASIKATRRWFEENEPSSPVIVLLRQAERMVGKRFSELAHVIPSELLLLWDAPDQ